MRVLHGIRVIAVLALAVGLALVGAGRVAAQDSGFTITTHAMECFEGVGAAIFEECHTDVQVFVDTFDDGNGTITLTISDEDLAGYLGAYVYCRDLVDDEVLFDGSYADGVAFSVEDGDDIVCDIYFITPAPAGGTDTGGTDTGGTDTGGTATGGVTTLPATGAGFVPGGQQATLLLALAAAALAGFGLSARRAVR